MLILISIYSSVCLGEQMAFTPLVLSPEMLESVLKRFRGCPVDEKEVTDYHRFAVKIFDNPTIYQDPRIHATFQIACKDIYKNYEQNYKSMAGATFTTFVKWILIKSQTKTPFLWRKLNNQWYEFYNLPMEVSVRKHVRRELRLHILENVSMSTWETFCKKHQDYKADLMKDYLGLDPGLPVHWLAYQMFNVHLPRMTSYYTTTRVYYVHQPWFVFSDRYTQNDNLYLPMYMNYSHVTLTPEDAEIFVNQFITLAKLKPNEVEQHCIELVRASPPRELNDDDTKGPGGNETLFF